MFAAVSLLLIAAGEMVDLHFSYTWTILFVLATLLAVAEIAQSSIGTYVAIDFCLSPIFTFYRSPGARNITLVIKDTARNNSLNELIFGRDRVARR